MRKWAALFIIPFLSSCSRSVVGQSADALKQFGGAVQIVTKPEGQYYLCLDWHGHPPATPSEMDISKAGVHVFLVRDNRIVKDLGEHYEIK